MRLFLALMLVASVLRADVEYLKDQPKRFLWGSQQHHTWDETSHTWHNSNWKYENWVRAGGPESVNRAMDMDPERVPVETNVTWDLDFSVYLKPEHDVQLAMAALALEAKKRLVLISSENNAEYEESYKIWPHLGLVTIGTIAHQEDWEVVLWDESILGHIPLEEVLEPGDTVGLSMVVSGMDRGVTLAQQAKRLGARQVIAGNDGAIFRASQLLRLDDQPIDAVFTSNSTNSVRQYFRLPEGSDLSKVSIPEMAVDPDKAILHGNDSARLRMEFEQRRQNRPDPMDGFVIPELGLYGPEYWDRVWAAYRSQYGHKHRRPDDVRGSLIHLAQGCTRTQGKEACSYCTIYGVADIRFPDERYLARLLEHYQQFGINNFYNATDSAFEMRPLVSRLQKIGFRTDTLEIYGRAQGLATQPQLIEQWLSLVDDRLLINCGMDSGDDGILSRGVIKSSLTKGSRLAENQQAMRNLSGSGAHLLYSLIFGSPGETTDSCERTLDFIQWSIDTLGNGLDVVETDIYWLNFGSPASRVFTDYDYAVELAALADKSITREDWWQDFGQHADNLTVPWSVEQAWYHHFTHISVEQAQAYMDKAKEVMDRHPGSIKGREYAFKPPLDA